MESIDVIKKNCAALNANSEQYLAFNHSEKMLPPIPEKPESVFRLSYTSNGVHVWLYASEKVRKFSTDEADARKLLKEKSRLGR